MTRVLGSLRDRGYLQMIGAKRGARYQLRPMAAARGGNEGPDIGTLDEDSDTFGHDIGTLVADTDNLTRPATSALRDLASMWTELLNIAQPARSRRYLDAAIRDEIVVQLCRRAPLSLQNISELLGRSEVLIRHALRGLIEAKRLFYLYPEQPRRPGQKYVAVPTETKQ